ncbi:MAG: hypothetical protein LBN20_03485 [Endomicrobium sp.]|jgi:DNA-binding transcriptional MerR regulator|nr:hypothetical protein [Endomicrobium sp.]
MNKKIILFLFNILIFANISFADVSFSNNPSGEIKNERMMLQEIRKEQLLFQKNLLDLLAKHNDASQDDKGKALEEIKALIAVQTEKEIKANKDFLKMQMERISQVEKKLKDVESNKTNYIAERAQFFINQYQQQGRNNTMIRRINITVQQ